MGNNITLNLIAASSSASVLLGAAMIRALVVHGHTATDRLLLYLSVCDVLACAGWLLSFSHDANSDCALCIFQGFMLEFFTLSSYMWTTVFAFHLFQLVRRAMLSEVNPSADVVRPSYHLLAWGFPVAVTLYFMIVMLVDPDAPAIGPAGRPWCWIQDESRNGEYNKLAAVQQWCFFYVPLSILFVLNASLYIFLSIDAKHYFFSLARVIRRKLLLYVFVFLLCTCWGLFARLGEVVGTKHETNDTLMNLDAFFGPAQGWLNALVYGRRFLFSCTCWKDDRLRAPLVMKRDDCGDDEIGTGVSTVSSDEALLDEAASFRADGGRLSSTGNQDARYALMR